MRRDNSAIRPAGSLVRVRDSDLPDHAHPEHDDLGLSRSLSISMSRKTDRDVSSLIDSDRIERETGRRPPTAFPDPFRSASHGLACFFALVLGSLAPGKAGAASLQVTPVLLEVVAPGAASLVTLRNTGPKPIHVQTRLFRWLQEAGKERLEPTADVVASPPAVELRPNQDYVVRVVRVRKAPVAREEAYRLLIDELPEPQIRARTVAFAVRHAIPLFFEPPNPSPAQATWRVTRGTTALTLIASNAGATRLRLANVKLSEGSGRTVSLGTGLLGYVLGASTMSWTMPAGKAAPAAGAKLAISGQTQEGPIRAQAVVESAR